MQELRLCMTETDRGTLPALPRPHLGVWEPCGVARMAPGLVLLTLQRGKAGREATWRSVVVSLALRLAPRHLKLRKPRVTTSLMLTSPEGTTCLVQGHYCHGAAHTLLQEW